MLSLLTREKIYINVLNIKTMNMKLKHLAGAFLALPLAYSCGQGGNQHVNGREHM